MTDGIRFAGLRLKPVTHDDRSRLRRWMTDSAIHAWWGAPAAIEAEIAIAIESESAICRMIEADGTVVGYGHAFDGGLMETRGGSRRPTEPGIWQCALLIGSEAHRGRGVGALGLDLLASEVFSTTLAIACETRIPVRNEGAVREIEAKGFRWRHIETDPTLGPHWIMRRDRTATPPRL